jgi:hypothetical protein
MVMALLDPCAIRALSISTFLHYIWPGNESIFVDLQPGVSVFKPEECDFAFNYAPLFSEILTGPGRRFFLLYILKLKKMQEPIKKNLSHRYLPSKFYLYSYCTLCAQC